MHSFETPWTEDQLLTEFWKAVDLNVERVQLLRLFSLVVVARPQSWNSVAVRRAFDQLRPRPHRTMLGCFSCFHRDRRLHRHHVILVRHGGSNEPQNLVDICDDTRLRKTSASCHQTLHLWMRPAVTSHETTHTRIDEYDSLGDAMLQPYALEIA